MTEMELAVAAVRAAEDEKVAADAWQAVTENALNEAKTALEHAKATMERYLKNRNLANERYATACRRVSEAKERLYKVAVGSTYKFNKVSARVASDRRLPTEEVEHARIVDQPVLLTPSTQEYGRVRATLVGMLSVAKDANLFTSVVASNANVKPAVAHRIMQDLVAEGLLTATYEVEDIDDRDHFVPLSPEESAAFLAGDSVVNHPQTGRPVFRQNVLTLFHPTQKLLAVAGWQS